MHFLCWSESCVLLTRREEAAYNRLLSSPVRHSTLSCECCFRTPQLVQNIKKYVAKLSQICCKTVGNCAFLQTFNSEIQAVWYWKSFCVDWLNISFSMVSCTAGYKGHRLSNRSKATYVSLFQSPPSLPNADTKPLLLHRVQCLASHISIGLCLLQRNVPQSQLLLVLAAMHIRQSAKMVDIEVCRDYWFKWHHPVSILTKFQNGNNFFSRVIPCSIF